MRKLLVAVVLVGLAAVTGRADNPKSSQDNKEPTKKETPPVSLKGGIPAPPLKASMWFQGEEVKRFEPGRVYVIEFWATWCGPCIAFMPHLAELQARYKDQGVRVIGFTNQDPNNSAEKVTAFVKKRGPKLNYTFAYADDKTMWDAWMTAAGRQGIPCNFVVDKAGRIAYIGHPMYLDIVLPMVVAGNAAALMVSDRISKIEAEFHAITRYDNFFRDPKAGLQALKEFEARYPPLADFFMSAKVKLSALPKHGKPGEAKEYTETLVAKAVQRDDRLTLELASSILRLGDGKESKELLAVAVTAAEAVVRMSDGTDAHALINLAMTYSVAGDKAKAKEYARKAVETAAGESPALRQSIEQQARKLDDGMKEDKK